MGMSFHTTLLVKATIVAGGSLMPMRALGQTAPSIAPYATEDLNGPAPGASDLDPEQANVDFVSGNGSIDYSQIVGKKSRWQVS